MALAVVIILLVVGSIVFHLASPWYFTEIASNWGMIDTTVDITLWVTGTVFVAVNLFLAYVIIKYRHSKDRKADYEPENKKLEAWLTVLTGIGVAAMLAPGLVVWAKFVEVPENASTVEAIGQQWNWRYRFPGEDGVLGTVSVANISLDNPFGLNPDDPNGQDDILVDNPHLHLPVDEPVKVLLRSTDVLHDFAVAEFRVKMDLVPGMVSYLWFEPTRIGTYDLLCEELCGIAHHAMRGKVSIDSRADFEAWLADQPTFGETMGRPGGDVVAGQARYGVCAACHGASGEGNQALNAPRLAGLDPWYLDRQLRYFKDGTRGSHEDDIYGQQMAPMAATLTDQQAIDDVVAYIASLPIESAPATLSGDLEHGRELYTTCAVCHGKDGGGVWTAGAPRQAGMDDWYLARQLKNYRAGIRGSHPDDAFGQQMTLMAKVLADDQAINDLVLYINSLR